MNIGQAGIDLIKSYEKCVLKAYLPTPDDVWTCGWGSTKDVTEDTVWTQEEANARFMQDIAWVEACINKAVKAEINQNEYDALCSLCFNIGCAAFSSSTLVKRLNGADYEGAAKQFARWSKQAGKELAGLTRRRAEEAALFDTA